MSYADRRQQQVVAEYRWKMMDCERQVEENFPLASIADNIWSRAFIEVFQQYGPSEKLPRLRAMIKRYMRAAVEALGEHVSPADSDLAGNMESQVNDIWLRNHFELNQKASRDNNSIKRPRMVSMIAAALKTSLGTTGRRGGSPDTRYYATPVADWYLGTQLLFGPRVPFEVRVALTLMKWPDEIVPATDPLTILLPYVSTWDVVTEDDAKRVADAMNEVLRYALTVVPEIASQITDYTPHPLGRKDHLRSP